MTSLIPNSAFDRIFNATLFGHFGSVKQVYPNRSRRSRTRLCTRTGRKDRRGKLLEQLDVCYEELSAAIMAELEDRERVNQELREKAHQKLDVAKELLHNFQGQLALKNNCNAQYSKFAGLISDRNKRFKSDTLRTLIEHVEILIKKLEPKHDTAEARTPDLSASSSSTPRVVATPFASPVIPPQKVDPPPETSKETLTENATTVDDPPKVETPPVAKNVPVIAVTPKVTVPLAESKIPADVSPAKVFTSTVEKDVGKVSQSDQQTKTPVPAREIISEVAKSKQQPQIPWRTPNRLEPVKVEKKEKEKKSSVSFVEPLKDKEPERLARRYTTKTKKRPAEDQPFMESQFKKPFPMGEQQNQPQKPLFQRRHQLPAPVYNSRDPRTYGEHCQRRVMQMQNRTRFESQNQQYYKQRPHMTPGPVVRPPTATAFPFVVPAPVPPTRPAPVLPTRPAPIVRPPAPRASVPPTFTKQAVVPSVSTPVVRPDIKRTINPVYSNDELIPLGKKELPKKSVAPSQTVPTPEKPKEDVPAKVDDIEVTEPKVVDVKITEPKAAEQVDEPKKADEKDKLLDQNLMEMLKEIGDEAKIKKILDVMNKKSDDEAEEEKSNAKEGAKTAKDKSAEKKTKKYKRIRSKVDESSSEEEPSKKEETKKPKAKPAKRVSGGCREVVHLLENMNDWMGRGQELHHTRRRGTTNAQTHQNVSPTTKAQSSVPKDGGTISSSDEESLPVAAKKHPVAEEESLLTVTGSPPAKGKSKKKEANFVYNDKKSVHCNSSYSSNCALCSFNGSAIVDHYVYEHKKYEVFISRISQKMADIIRADPFVTNGILLTGEGGVEKISFKCYFCLASKELTSAKWTEHLASHTGEYRFRCTSCPVMSQTEELESTFFHEKTCLKPSLAIYNNIEFQDNHLYGFICDACNYIQIRRVNMERHLKREHPSADVTCSRFSIVNHKVETKPIIDEEQMMADMLSARSQTPTVLIPFQAKAEPQDACEIVNQPFTEDEDMLEQESLATPAQLMRRTDIRLESIHIGSAGVANQLGHRPFSFKMEQELQGDQISSSAAFYESPMSPEPASMEENLSEAQAVIPVLQIQSVQGGFDMSKVFFKHEKDDGDYDSDASDKTTDFNMSDASEEGRQVAQNTSEGEKKNAGGSNGEGTGSGSSSANGSGVEPSSGSGSATGGGAAGSGGDDGDDRKKEEFPLPFKIKVEKDGENEEKKEENESLTSNLGNVVIKSEKRDEDPDDPPKAEGEYDFVELVLDSTRIEHVAFIEYQSEILFLCLMPGCQYITKKSGDISKHLSKKHGQVQWDGYCHPCQSQISILDNCSITNELQHLLDIHARRKTPTLEITDVRSTTSNVIRIRKMPGDTLSAGEINPPPLAPLISPVTTNMVAGPSTVTFGQSPMIIQSAATIQAMPVGGNTMITPTHTIPAQIRPVMHKTATTIAPASSPPSLTHPAGGASIPSLAGLRINTVRLKPWTNMVTTKNQEHCRSMLEEISLLCLYKCMARSCAFTTSNRYFMEQHLTLHENIHTGGPNAPRKCWLECAYCDLIAPNNIVLLTHIDGEHASCGFQCNLCFYRSRDPTNVVVHQKTYHPTGNIPKNILIMPENLKSFGDDEWKAMQESLRKNVLPLYCTICKESFYILSAYMTHLAGHIQSFVLCQVCNLNIEKKSMARHLLLHSIGLYECVYCLFGANTKSTMALHVSNAHSSKPLYCCVRYNKKRPDGVDYPPNKIESMELKTMSCTVSPDLFKRCNYTQDQMNYKPIDLQPNQMLSYPKKIPAVAKIASNAVATPAPGSMPANPTANIQIQITDEAGRPLIISIPVQNAATSKPAAPVPNFTNNPPPAPHIQMPMISTVQGGFQASPQSQQAPLPIISSVQGMVQLPPLTAIPRNDGLPVISSVQSVAHLPPSNDHPTSFNSHGPKPPTLAAITPSGLVSLPNIPGITITARPVTTCAASSSTSVTSAQAVPAPMPIITSVDSISTLASRQEARNDMYTTTVAEADTQSSNAVGGHQESDDDVRASSSKSSTPAQSQSPAPSATPQQSNSRESLSKKFSNTTQIRIDFLFNGSIEKFDRLEKKVSQMIRHTGYCGQELNTCGVDKCNNRFSDPVKLNLHLLKHHNVSNYKCYHCSDRFKTAHELITHIKTHGRHRYLCFLCERKSHFLKMMILHVQHDHNSTDVILTYLHPKKRDIHNDLVVICPQNVTSPQLQSYVDNILKDGDVAEKKRFAPSEIDQLPPEEIFAEDMYCASCEYTTKIRKNLKRHLERHSDLPSLTVTITPAAVEPAPAPTPLAPPLIVAATADIISSDKFPKLVDPIKLYKCGVCNFDCPPVLADFRSHLYRIHRNEKVYSCPHCSLSLNEGFLCIDKIVNHLKVHGENLYKCTECDFCRDEKYLITAHISQNHGSSPSAGVMILREAESMAEPEWQCDLCETIRQTRAEMVDHMTTDHKLTDKQYKCSYCSYKSSDNDSFKSHFATTHPGSEILIISLFHELPRKHSANHETFGAAKASQELLQDGSQRNKFACGFESCSYTSDDLEENKKHFLASHPDQTMVVFDESVTEKEKRKRFDYFVKYVCNYCQMQCDLIDDVVEHWNNQHKEENGGKPLMFKLFKLVRCFYCDKLSSYYDIKMHAMVNHPGQTFACVDHQNVFKCGECPYVLTGAKIDLLKHFKIYHSTSKNDDPCDYIDDEFLHRMLEQNSSLYTCNHCKLTYESRFEYENHIDICAFAGKASSFALTSKSVRIRYICSCCNDMFSNEYSIAKHMRTHLAQYNCRYCKREFKQLSHLNQHQVLLHQAHDSNFLLKDLNQYRSFFLKIKMLFPNGLLLSKVDAYRTVCGSVEDIINYARTVNEEEMTELMYSRAIEMPLHYENSDGETTETSCKQFMESRPASVLMLENLTSAQISEIQEQVYLLAKAAATVEHTAQRKRGRPRKFKKITTSNTETDDENDDDWRPTRKRQFVGRVSERVSVVRTTIKQEIKEEVMKAPLVKEEVKEPVKTMVSSDSSDDELLINLKKEIDK